MNLASSILSCIIYFLAGPFPFAAAAAAFGSSSIIYSYDMLLNIS